MSSNGGRISPVCGSSLLPQPLSCYSLDDHLLDLTGPVSSSSSSNNNTPNCPLGAILHSQSFQLQWGTHRCAQVHNPSPHPQTPWLERLPGSSQWPVEANHIDHWSDSVILGKRTSNTEGMDLELLAAAAVSWEEKGDLWQIQSQRKETQNQGTSNCALLQKEMATHSSVFAWRIPGTREPGGLPSMGSHRVGHDWSDLAAAATVPEQILPRTFQLLKPMNSLFN